MNPDQARKRQKIRQEAEKDFLGMTQHQYADLVRALFEPVTPKDRFRTVRLQLEINALNKSEPSLRLQLPSASHLNAPDLIICREKFWEYQEMCFGANAPEKVARLLTSFLEKYPLEWQCCGWKNDAIADLVLGKLSVPRNGKKPAVGWVRDYWKRQEKSERQWRFDTSEKRKAARSAISQLETLQLLDKQEEYLNTLDPSLLDPSDDLRELLEKRRQGVLKRPATYTDYVHFIRWLDRNRISLAKERPERRLPVAVHRYTKRNKTVLSDRQMIEACAAYARIMPAREGQVDPYPVILSMVAQRHCVSPRLVTKVRAGSNRKQKDSTRGKARS